MTGLDARAGAAVYSAFTLRLYDIWVIRLSNSFGWRCRSSYFLDSYRRHLARRHLEVGPGSGWALANIELPPDIDLTLLDLNSKSLDHTQTRLDVATTRLEHNILEPFAREIAPFDSISINYVLHCLPGRWADKKAAVSTLSRSLTPNGVLFGSTVLGANQRFNPFGRALMAVYNRTGVFSNRSDDLHGLRAVLSEYFDRVEIDLVGNVALFVARDRSNGSSSQ